MKLFLSIVSLTALSMMSCGNGTTKTTNSCDNCERFRNGKFDAYYTFEDEKIHCVIERNDSIQYETSLPKGTRHKLLVRWSSPCVYELKLTESTDPNFGSIESYTVWTRMEIINCTDNYYVYQASRGNSPMLMDTLWVVK